MKNFTSRFFATLLVGVMIIVASCTKNDDEGVTPVSTAPSVRELAAALDAGALIESTEIDSQSFVAVLDNGDRYAFTYETSNVYTVATTGTRSGDWLLNYTNVTTGDSNYNWLRAKTTADADPVEVSSRYSHQDSDIDFYWEAQKMDNGFWYWNGFYPETGALFVTYFRVATDPDVIYNYLDNKLTLVIDGKPYSYVTTIVEDDDAGTVGDTSMSLTSTEFTWHYSSALAKEYTFTVPVSDLRSYQCEYLVEVGDDPIFSVVDPSTGETLEYDYEFAIDESKAVTDETVDITLTGSNLADAASVNFILTYVGLGDNEGGNLIVTLPVTFSGAPTATVTYIYDTESDRLSTDYYWSITSTLYDDVYKASWSLENIDDMFNIYGGVSTGSLLVDAVKSMEFDATSQLEYYAQENDGELILDENDQPILLSKINKIENSIALDVYFDKEQFNYGMQMSFDDVSMTDEDSGFKVIIAPAFFTVNNSDRVALFTGDTAAFEWSYTRSAEFYTNGSGGEQDYNNMVLIDTSGTFSEHTALQEYVAGGGDFYFSLGSANTGTTSGIYDYSADNFDVSMFGSKNLTMVNVTLKNTLAAVDANFNILLTFPGAIGEGDDVKDVEITIPVTIKGAPKIYTANNSYHVYKIGSSLTMNAGYTSLFTSIPNWSSTTETTPDGYDDWNDVYYMFDADKENAKLLLIGCVAGGGTISSVYQLLGSADETQPTGYAAGSLGVDVNDCSIYGDGTFTTVGMLQTNSALTDDGIFYVYKRTADRAFQWMFQEYAMQTAINGYDFYASYPSTTAYTSKVSYVKCENPTGFTYTVLGLSAQCYLYEEMVKVEEYFDSETGYATVTGDDGLIDGLFDSQSLSTTTTTNGDIVIHYEVLNPNGLYPYPEAKVGDSDLYVISWNGYEGTTVEMEAYIMIGNLKFNNSTYSYQTFTLDVGDEYEGYVRDTEMTGSAAFAWDYTTSKNGTAYVAENIEIAESVPYDEYNAIREIDIHEALAAEAMTFTVTSTSNLITTDDIEIVFSDAVDSDTAAKSLTLTVNNNKLVSTETLMIYLVYPDIANNGEDVAVTLTVEITGAPTVTIPSIDLGNIDIKNFNGDSAPWSYIFGSIKDFLTDSATWNSDAAYTDWFENLDEISTLVELSDTYENAGLVDNLSINESDELQFNVSSYALEEQVTYTSVGINDPVSGFSATFTSLGITIVDDNVVITRLDESQSTPTLTWNYVVSNEFTGGSYSGSGYTTDKVIMDELLTDDLYEKISGVSPVITLGGDDNDLYDASDISIALSQNGADSYSAQVTFTNTLATTTSSLYVDATYSYDDNGTAKSVVVRVPVNITGAPKLYSSRTEDPTVNFTSAMTKSSYSGLANSDEMISLIAGWGGSTTAQATGYSFWNTEAVYSMFSSEGRSAAEAIVEPAIRTAMNGVDLGMPAAEHYTAWWTAGAYGYGYRLEPDGLKAVVASHDFYANYPESNNYYGDSTTATTNAGLSYEQTTVTHPSGFSFTLYLFRPLLNFYSEIEANESRFSAGYASVAEVNGIDGVLDGIYSVGSFSTGDAAQLAATTVKYEMAEDGGGDPTYPTVRVNYLGQYIIDWNGYSASEVKLNAYLMMPLEGSDVELTFHEGAADAQYCFKTFTLKVDEDFMGYTPVSDPAYASITSDDYYAWSYANASTSTNYSISTFELSANSTLTEEVLDAAKLITPSISVVNGEFDSNMIKSIALGDNISDGATLTLDHSVVATSYSDVKVQAIYANAAGTDSDMILDFTFDIVGAPTVAMNAIDYGATPAENATYYTLTSIADALTSATWSSGSAYTWIGDETAIETFAKAFVLDATYTSDQYSLTAATAGELGINFTTVDILESVGFDNVSLSANGVVATIPSVDFSYYVVATEMATETPSAFTWDYIKSCEVSPSYEAAKVEITGDDAATIYATLTGGSVSAPQYILSGTNAEYYADAVSVALSTEASAYYATVTIANNLAKSSDDLVVTVRYSSNTGFDLYTITLPVTIEGAPMLYATDALTPTYDISKTLTQELSLGGASMIVGHTSNTSSAPTGYDSWASVYTKFSSDGSNYFSDLATADAYLSGTLLNEMEDYQSGLVPAGSTYGFEYYSLSKAKGATAFTATVNTAGLKGITGVHDFYTKFSSSSYNGFGTTEAEGGYFTEITTEHKSGFSITYASVRLAVRTGQAIQRNEAYAENFDGDKAFFESNKSSLKDVYDSYAFVGSDVADVTVHYEVIGIASGSGNVPTISTDGEYTVDWGDDGEGYAKMVTVAAYLRVVYDDGTILTFHDASATPEYSYQTFVLISPYIEGADIDDATSGGVEL